MNPDALPRRRAAGVLTLVAAATLIAPQALAQQWRVSPTVRASTTFSSNLGLTRDNEVSGWLADIAPGITIRHLGPYDRLYLDARWHRVETGEDVAARGTERFLDAGGRLHLPGGGAFIDGRGEIRQQSRTIFAPVSAADRPASGENRVETRVLQAAPGIRGELPGYATYRAQWVESQVRTRDSTLEPTRTSQVQLNAGSPASRTFLGWSVDGGSTSVRNDTVGRLHDSRVAAGLVAAWPTFRASVLGGYERTDFAGSLETSETYGLGAEWLPDARTRAVAVVEHRFFGTGYRATASLRTGRLAFRFAASRDAEVLPGLLAPARPGSLDALFTTLLAHAEPDADARPEVARRRAGENGLASIVPLGQGFLVETPSLYDRLDASVAWRMPRDFLVLGVARQDRRELPGTALPPRGESGRQDDIQAHWAHRLTPLTAITLTGRALRAESFDGARRTRQRNVNVALATRLAPRVQAMLEWRYLHFTGTAGIVRENAMIATITARY